uniref:Uncharacterized protein n=1 Tax=Schistocephalus solidus TaxID=70667 RepID=A0A0V0J8K1_SCHSO
MVRTYRISSPYLNFLRRKKEQLYKLGLHDRLKDVSVLIKSESSRLNALFVSQLFASPTTLTGVLSSVGLWRNLKRLTGQCGKLTNVDADLDYLNDHFINTSTDYNPLLNNYSLLRSVFYSYVSGNSG